MTSAPDFVYTDDLDKYTSGDEQAIIEQVQAAVRSYLKWHLSPEITETVTLDGDGSNYLWLQSLNVTGVTSVTNEGTVLTSDDYDWSANGYLKLTGWCDYWSTRPRQVVVTFTHGFSEPPADVVGVVAAIASRAATSPTGTTSEQAGQVRLTYGTFNGVSGGVALLQHERDILNVYRIPARP